MNGNAFYRRSGAVWRVLRAGAALAVLSFAAACSAIVEERGYVLDERDLDEIQVGATNKEDVQEIMGSPSTVATVDGDSWYYISSTVETYGWQKPEVIDRLIVAVYFDEEDVVEEFGFYGLEDGRIVNFVDRETPTRGKQLTFLEQLFGNVGRFNRLGGAQQ